VRVQPPEAAPIFALAFFGLLVHERSNCVLASLVRMSRLVKPCRQCSPAIRLLNSLTSDAPTD
jgi:hypothetical protein